MTFLNETHRSNRYGSGDMWMALVVEQLKIFKPIIINAVGLAQYI